MAARYEIKDTHRPTDRGGRFNSEDRARRELAHCVGAPGRFALIDRETKEVLAVAP